MFFFQCFQIIDFNILSGPDDIHFYERGNELHEILVSGNHVGFNLALLSFFCQCGNHIIRLKTRLFNHRYVEGIYQFHNAGILCGHFFRHLLPRGLVFCIFVMAEGRLFGIEHYRNIVRLLFRQKLHQRAYEAKHGAGIFSLRIKKRVTDEGEIGAIKQGGTVDEKESFCFGHCQSLNFIFYRNIKDYSFFKKQKVGKDIW